MAPLSEHRAGIVRSLIGAAPDSALHNLEMALRGEITGGSLSAVREIVNTEVRDRTVRNAVLAPIAPLFAARADGFDQLRFSAETLSRLWRAIRSAFPNEAAYASAMPLQGFADDGPPPVFDDLCRLAAQALREEADAFAGVREALAGAEAELIACLELAPVARRALEQLPGWLTRMTDERSAAARLAYKDAVAIADDDGPRLFEILFSHLEDPWTILRIISAVMLKPGDRYASGSELADFGDRLLRDVDRRIAVIKAFDPAGGVDAGRQAAEALRVAAAVTGEFDLSLAIDREGPWGEQLARQKQALAGMAEANLKKVDRAVGEALPMQPVRLGGRVVKSARGEPRLDQPPNPVAVARASALLAFFAGSRAAAAQGGYGSTRAKAQEELTLRLEGYTEELLVILHAGESEHLDHAHDFLDVVAQFTGFVHDEDAAQIVRRRAAAA